MQTILHVKGMTCSHCENAVKSALTELGCASVHVDLSTGIVNAESEKPIAADAIIAAIEEEGYEAEIMTEKI